MNLGVTRRLMRSKLTVDVGALRVGGALMLAAAAVLPLLPGPDGLPCPLRSLTGIPCPLCGTTTSVIAAVHLRPLQAMAASPAGVPAVALAVCLLLFRGRDEADVPRWALLLGLVFLWVWQLVRFGVL